MSKYIGQLHSLRVNVGIDLLNGFTCLFNCRMFSLKRYEIFCGFILFVENHPDLIICQIFEYVIFLLEET